MIPKLVINIHSKLKEEKKEDKLHDKAKEILQDLNNLNQKVQDDLDSIRQKVQELQSLIDVNN